MPSFLRRGLLIKSIFFVVFLGIAKEASGCDKALACICILCPA